MLIGVSTSWLLLTPARIHRLLSSPETPNNRPADKLV